MNANTRQYEEYDFVIAGAGAAGLFAALLLHQRGFSVKLFDKKSSPSSHSRSIGIHPPSLNLLHEAGVLKKFLNHGLSVTEGRAIVTKAPSRPAVRNDISASQAYHTVQDDTAGTVASGEAQSKAGKARAKTASKPHKSDIHQIIRDRTVKMGNGENADHILVVPQYITERILTEALPEGTVQRSSRVAGFEQDANGVRVQIQHETGELKEYQCSYLLGADGMYSDVRSMSGIPWKGKTYSWPFCMGDFPDNTKFGSQAVIYLTPEGLVESFPLPGGLRRWVINVDPDAPITDDNSDTGVWHTSTDGKQVLSGPNPTVNLLIDAVYHRTGHQLSPAEMHVFSSFRAHRYSSESSVNGRVILLGDAAHVISPIGGQGMNFGWMNIRALVDKLQRKSDGVHTSNSDLSGYDRFAAGNAQKFGKRAHFNTLVGLPGKPAFLMALITDLLLSAPLQALFVRRFTMR
ncbi:MAG: FAD-dependent monooxygenase [Bacteroidetes bacterium]|nr:FAD-dependent monooxygenase [Bacteroidota bacterium]MCH8525321.1 FAD-dependent monooxygenase [Balneolales bacterium]